MFTTSLPERTVSDWIKLNSGIPEVVPIEVDTIEKIGDKSRLIFVSESGLKIPALFWQAKGNERAVIILVSENGKALAAEEFNVEKLQESGISCLAIDPRGLGELKGLDLRLETYLGQAPAFGMGLDITRAISTFIPTGKKIAVVGRGPTAGITALIAALMEPRIGFVAGLATLKDFTDAFHDDVPLLSIQPRANYAPSLANLRSFVKAETMWSFLSEPEPDWTEALIRWVQR